MHHHGCIPFSVFLTTDHDDDACGKCIFERKMKMKLTINGKNVTLDKPTTVSEYLAANGYKPARIAVEINEVILPKDQYETHNLCEGDLVEIVTFMGGG